MCREAGESWEILRAEWVFAGRANGLVPKAGGTGGLGRKGKFRQRAWRQTEELGMLRSEILIFFPEVPGKNNKMIYRWHITCQVLTPHLMSYFK